MTLFERLGGAEGVRRVVDELTTRLEADPGLAPLFAGVDGDGLRRHRERYLAAVLGGLVGRDRDLDNVDDDGNPNEYRALADANPYEG